MAKGTICLNSLYQAPNQPLVLIELTLKFEVWFCLVWCCLALRLILMLYIYILPLKGYTLQFDLDTEFKILFSSGTEIWLTCSILFLAFTSENVRFFFVLGS